MKKMDMHTTDIVDENIKRIGKLFPNCLTERLNEEGKPEMAIDFDQLRQELSKEIVEGNEERYQFTWPDKRNAIRLANAPTTDTLRPCREESVDFDNTQNLYIEGDNLQVLKLLRENYLGKVKMIYIDPPYNTGNDFVYNDNFSQSAGEYMHNSGQTDEEGNRLVANTESNGRFHTKWLNMIYPRLKVAKDLLSEDGVIFISIDDKEAANLIKVANEIFGEHNFVGNIIWQSRTSISNDDEISTNHNHTLVYSRNRETLTFGGDDIDITDYVNPDNDPRGPWKLVPIDANHVGGDTNYPVRNPKTGIDYYPPNGRIWCYNKDTMAKLMADGRIKFGLNDDSSPKRKLFYNERMEKGDTKTPSSILLDAGTTKTGTTEIMDLFDGRKIFDYPKPTALIQRLLKYGWVRDNDIVIDFFSGSGTTLHSIFKYEIEKEVRCKTILVQYPENLDETVEKASNDAKKTIKEAIKFLDSLGKPHKLTEIGKERIRRAGKKIKEDSPLTTQDLDIGFRVLKLDSSNMQDVYYTPAEFSEQKLLEDNIKPDRTEEDLLFQTMIDLGIELSAKIEKRSIAGKAVWSVSDGYLMVCFDEEVNETTITEIARQHPYYFVMRDSSLANDQVADNFEQIWEEYSKDTVRRIL
ncbi:MAG: site-specific DNA-methyltransferase [Bacteroidaceae bacterium]|nr:site-specific DNA-methyltransferase [Bacteroidaceae bacterium]